MGLASGADVLEFSQPLEMDDHEMATLDNFILFGPWEIDGRRCVCDNCAFSLLLYLSRACFISIFLKSALNVDGSFLLS